MKPLLAFLDADFNALDSSLHDLDLTLGRSLSKEGLRARLLSSGRRIRALEIALPSEEIGFVCGDSSNAVRELRYHALWGVHSVCVYGVYDGTEHEDVLVGHGKIRYRDLLYSSKISLGSLVPYSEVDSRTNSLRVYHELKMLLSSVEELQSEGRRVDYILMDGSLHTNLSNLAKKEGGFPEDSIALEVLKKLLKFPNLVGFVEDSHATDLAGELGFDYTNMLLFDVGLNPLEYVVDEREGIYICYLKLPPKKLGYLPSGESSPLTVRWEFNKKDFEKDLNKLASIWMQEDDILHPQLYPLRIADYLTRKLKVGGIIDTVIQENGLDLKYRDLREG